MLVVSHDRRFLETIVRAAVGGRRRPAWRRSTAAIEPGARPSRTAGRWRAPSSRRPGGSARRAPQREVAVRARGRGDDDVDERHGGEGRHSPARTAPHRVRAWRPRPRAPSAPKLSKDAYRRQRETVDAELTRLGLRKNHLELELSKPAVPGQLHRAAPRVTSELADVDTALAAAEDAWLALEERAP